MEMNGVHVEEDWFLGEDFPCELVGLICSWFLSNFSWIIFSIEYIKPSPVSLLSCDNLLSSLEAPVIFYHSRAIGSWFIWW